MALVGMAIENLACSFACEDDQVVVVEENIIDTRPVTHRSAVEEVDVVVINRINQALDNQLNGVETTHIAMKFTHNTGNSVVFKATSLSTFLRYQICNKSL